MARREQAGGGPTPRGGASGGSAGRRGGRARRSNRSRRAAHRATRASSQKHSHAPSHTPSHAALGEHPAAGSVWHGAAALGGVEPLRMLATAAAQAHVAITLAGAEQATLSDTLRAWGAGRDLAANRAWRRPGGLVRMAGL